MFIGPYKLEETEDPNKVWVRNKKSGEVYQITKKYYHRNKSQYDQPSKKEIISTQEEKNKSKEPSTPDDKRIKRNIVSALKKGTFSSYVNQGFDNGDLAKIIPEFAMLKNTEQDPIHHPEGHTEIHTKYVVKEAEKITNDKRVIFAALLHDVGKATTTEKDENDKITAHGHEEESAKMADKALKRMRFDKKFTHDVVFLCRYHMLPHFPDVSRKKIHKMTRKYGKELMDMLVQVARADKRGRPPKKSDEKYADRFQEFINSFKE